LNELAKNLEQNTDFSNKDYGSPTPEKKDSTLVLFRELIKSDDSRKFGNLGKEELGKLDASTRGLLKLGLFCETQNLPELALYFQEQAEIILATSLSFKGKLIDNIVTQIKKEQKTSGTPSIIKKGMFSTKVIEPGGDSTWDFMIS